MENEPQMQNPNGAARQRAAYAALLVVLVLADFFSKRIVLAFFPDADFYIIEKFLGFRPYLNTANLSAFNRVFKMGIPLKALTAFNALALLAVPLLWLYLRRKNLTGTFADIGFVFGIAGCAASLLDKLVYGGSWDFIIFYKWIIDFKDIYLTVTEVIIVVFVLKLALDEQRRKNKKREETPQTE